MASSHAAFVAPLPPPVHGFSSISAAMCDLMRSRARLQIFDRTPRGAVPGRALLSQLLKALSYLSVSVSGRTRVLYLALSGGKGQLLDLPFILIARLTRQHVVIHHHSFAYLNAPTWLSRSVFALLGQQTHIVLSQSMAFAMTRRYPVNPERLIVLSNAAFLPPAWPEDSTRVPETDPGLQGPIRLGFLSNITFAKGFIEFFQVLQELHRAGVGYQAYIAGPVAPEARRSFEQHLANSSGAIYEGALYGDAKDRFFRQIDVLLFPTKYANEADPLVIHEALRSSTYVIACDRGAISDTLANGAGLVLPEAGFAEAAAAHIRGLTEQRSELSERQRLACAQSQRLHAEGVLALNRALAHVLDGLASSAASASI